MNSVFPAAYSLDADLCRKYRAEACLKSSVSLLSREEEIRSQANLFKSMRKCTIGTRAQTDSTEDLQMVPSYLWLSTDLCIYGKKLPKVLHENH